MAIFTIADLHLSFDGDKPMDIFGDNWKNHEEKIRTNWIENVKENDMVILPGDFSWSMYLKGTLEDFKYLNNLPGKKLLLKGNHDYWWETLKKMRNFIKENNLKNIDFIYNNSYEFENKVIVGTRGWSENETIVQDNDKMINREAIRLEISIKDGIEKYIKENNKKEIIAFLHYPPITKQDIEENKKSKFVDVLEKYKIHKCYYGHLHAGSIKEAINGNYYGIDFKLVSADSLEFEVFEIR